MYLYELKFSDLGAYDGEDDVVEDEEIVFATGNDIQSALIKTRADWEDKGWVLSGINLVAVIGGSPSYPPLYV